jgi:hypothetical protein
MNLAICASLGIVERRRDARAADEAVTVLRSLVVDVMCKNLQWLASVCERWGEGIRDGVV